MTDKQILAALIAATSAVVHYQEYLDGGHSLDRLAAEGALRTPALRKWVKENPELLPMRRDFKTILEVIKK